MIDNFIEEYFDSMKEYNDDPNKGVKRHTYYNLMRFLFYPYFSFFILLLVLYFFKKYIIVQVLLMLLIFFLLIGLVIVDCLNKSKIRKFRARRRKYFLDKYLNSLVLYKSQSESEHRFEHNLMSLNLSHTKDENDLAPSIKELASIIKELASKSKKRFSLNFSLLPFLMTVVIASINFSNTNQAVYLYFLFSSLVIMLFIFLTLIYRIIEKIKNRRSVQLEELHYILSELHLLVLHSERKLRSTNQKKNVAMHSK